MGKRIKGPWVKNLIHRIFQLYQQKKRRIVHIPSLYQQIFRRLLILLYHIDFYIATLSININSNLIAKKYLSNPVFFLYLFYCFAMSLSFVLCSHTAHNIFIGIESYNRNNRFMVKKCI